MQDRQLESLPGEREGADTGEHGERDGADLEDHEEDRHGQVGDPLPNQIDERAEPGDQGHRAEVDALLSLKAREDALEFARDLRGLFERHAGEREVDVPRVLGGQFQPRRCPDQGVDVDDGRLRPG